MMTRSNPWLGFFSNLPDHEPWDIITRPPKAKRKRKRRMTLARAMKQAGEAGVSVESATINADGSVTLLFGETAQQSNVAAVSEWDEVLQ